MQPPVPIGSMLADKYRIERVIGHGGMGVVVLATHDELDQKVAIKFLSPEGAKGTEWISRFAREAKAAAKIKNEHAVKVFDVGRLETGIPYMVMEYLEGKNFDEVIETEHTLPVADACEYILQACEALAEAHLVGIVHRDLKPANLFVTHKGDGTTIVKILDFGISKIDENLSPGALAPVTHTQSLVGSPLYMSPERLRGSKDVDRRADIWSLGVILQEIITGSPPFVADTIPDIHALVLTTAPPPLRRGAPHAPQELEAIVQKCLQKAPEHRFQNVLELAQALGTVAPASMGSVERIKRISIGGSGPRDRISLASASGAFQAPKSDLVDTVAAPSVPIPRESFPTVSATRGYTLGDRLKSSRGKIAGVIALVCAVVISSLLLRKQSAHHATVPVPAKTAAPIEPSATVPVSTATVTKVDVQPAMTTELVAPPSALLANGTKGPAHLRTNARDAQAPLASAHATASAPVPPPPPSDTNSVDYGGRN